MGPIRFEAVAWAPYTTEDLDWMQRRDGAAVAWVQERCRAEGRPGVLRVASHARDYAQHYNDAAMRAFARASTIVTNRGAATGHGPTFVPWAYARELAGGMRCASGSSLVATEHPQLPLEGWAMALGAVNLRTGEVTEDTRTPEQQELIEQVVSTAYNGWTSAPGDSAARRVLPELAESGLSWATFFGSVLAIEPHRADPKELMKVSPAAWVTEDRRRLRRNAGMLEDDDDGR